MGEFFSVVHSLDKLDTFPVICQVLAIKHYVMIVILDLCFCRQLTRTEIPGKKCIEVS